VVVPKARKCIGNFKHHSVFLGDEIYPLADDGTADVQIGQSKTGWRRESAGAGMRHLLQVLSEKMGMYGKTSDKPAIESPYFTTLNKSVDTFNADYCQKLNFATCEFPSNFKNKRKLSRECRYFTILI